MPRFIVRRGQGEHRYSVWDSERNTVAVTDLDMQDAFDAADKLNAAPVQQQQQPQPENGKKE
jgi:hypothetical protein